MIATEQPALGCTLVDLDDSIGWLRLANQEKPSVKANSSSNHRLPFLTKL